VQLVLFVGPLPDPVHRRDGVGLGAVVDEEELEQLFELEHRPRAR
jgi:hypothetical protein